MEPAPGGPTPAAYGVGARVSLHPMSDRYVDIILGALADTQPVLGDLVISTGAVSTFVGGDEEHLLTYLTTLVSSAARRSEGEHLAVSLLLSRGCPGEVTCDLTSGPWASDSALAPQPAGIDTVAEWSLYPLLDAGDTAAEHMGPIMAAIDEAKRTALYAGSDHYVTRLRGDVAAVLALVMRAWRDTGRSVQHVTSHLSLSFNSPTKASNS